jgi:hypothetical protein
MAIDGSITLNGVSDREMVRIWEYKAKDGTKFTFTPQTMHPVNDPRNQQFTGVYNNVTFSWKDEVGLKVVHEILDYLLKKDQIPTAVAQ